MKTALHLFVIVLISCIAGCGDGLPFEAEYTSKNRVVITYQGKKYILERYGIPTQAPFTYRFEDDGDIDLTIDGRIYDVDSPYDRDKKKKKKVIKKKSTSKNSSKPSIASKESTKKKVIKTSKSSKSSTASKKSNRR